VLTAVGDRLSKSVRASDVRCRYGGDEFLVILPDTPSRGAQHVAEALRKEMASLSLREHAQVSVTISVGVATALPGETATASLLDRADRALYRAKQDGRNRVATAHNPTPFVVARSQPGAIVASAS
jgi:diguanylate cyclase (GGDEF)-like protein